MYEHLKNSYLQTDLNDVSPGLINRCVQQAWEFQNCDTYDLQPPFNRLTSEQPSIPVKNVDVTRRPQAFGRWALPKLKMELHHKDVEVVLQAISSICDLVHNPEKGYEAINLHIIDRLSDLIVHEVAAVRERVAKTLTILAGLGEGRLRIIKNEYVLNNLLNEIEDPQIDVRIQVAACVEMISKFWEAADVLNKSGFIGVLLGNLIYETQAIVEIHLDTLKYLMYNGVGVIQAIHDDAFQIFISLLETSQETIVAKSCQCLSRLTSTKTGQLIAYDIGLLTLINPLLYNECAEIHTSALSIVMFCTVKTKAKIAAWNIKNLIKRLIELSQNILTPTAQMYALQSLTNLCDLPQIRHELKNLYYDDIESIKLNDDDDMNLMKFKMILLDNINWISYEESEDTQYELFEDVITNKNENPC